MQKNPKPENCILWLVFSHHFQNFSSNSNAENQQNSVELHISLYGRVNFITAINYNQEQYFTKLK